MEHIKQEVEALSKKMFHQWILFTDKKTLKRVVELREHFSQEIIYYVEERIQDNRTNAEIRRVLDNHMQQKLAA